VAVSELKRPLHGGFESETDKKLTATCLTDVSTRECPFGCNDNVTAVAVGKSRRLYSDVRMFTGNYLSSPPQILHVGGAQLEQKSLTSPPLSSCDGRSLSPPRFMQWSPHPLPFVFCNGRRPVSSLSPRSCRPCGHSVP
jgi:hypothetical protein